MPGHFQNVYFLGVALEITVLALALLEAVFYFRLNREKFNWNEFRVSMIDLVIRRFLAIYLPVGALLYFAGDEIHAKGPLAFTWSTLAQFVLAFILVDFIYYLRHLWRHKIRVFWNFHYAHHNVTQINIANANRVGPSRSFGLFIFYPFFWLLGLNMEIIFMATVLNYFYQALMHNMWMGRWGIFEKFMMTPSHHRVHHALDKKYHDTNYGGVFIVFDKIFGTFTDGTKVKIESFGIEGYSSADSEYRLLYGEWDAYFREKYLWIKSKIKKKGA